MKNYIKGNYRKSIFSSPKGYVIGLFKVKDTNDERLVDYVNKMITFTTDTNKVNIWKTKNTQKVRGRDLPD